MPPSAARRSTFAIFALNGFLLGMWVVHIPEIRDRTGASTAVLGYLLLLLGGAALLGMNLHPAVVLLSVTAGGSLFGITGAFLAVPVVASVAEVLRYLNERIDDSVSVLAPEQDSKSAEILAED